MDPRTGAENRRSARIVKRVPLRIDTGAGPTFEAYSAVINMHGALLVAPHGFPDDTILGLTNLDNQVMSRARVIWSGGQTGGTGFKLGVEFLDGVDFWGDAYDPEAEG
jgi:hypothetical protein